MEQPFAVDERITSTCFVLGDWPLSRVFLKNNASNPWIILVPRVLAAQEIDDLDYTARHQLMDEMSQLASMMREYFKPDKLNVGYLGNCVPQLHVHLVARFTHDSLWPQGIWQAASTDTPYTDQALAPLLANLRDKIHWLRVYLTAPT